MFYTSYPPQTLTQPTFQPSTETMSVTYGATSATNTRLKIHVVKSDGGVWKGLCGATLVEGLVADPDVREVCAKCEKSSRPLEVTKRVGAPSAPGDVDGGARRGVAAAVGTGGGGPTPAVVGVRAASSTGAGAGAGSGGGGGRAVQAATVVAPETRVVGPYYKSKDPRKVEWVGYMRGLVDALKYRERTREVDRVIGLRFFPGWRVSEDGAAVFVCTSKEETTAWDAGYQSTQEFYAPLGGCRDPYPMPDDCIIWSWMFEHSSLECVWATMMW